jgi:ferredoxin-like protein FixX
MPCLKKNCKVKQPHFNLKGKTVGLYCSKHKKENMINVKAKTCLECDTRPHFNLKGKTVGLYCSKHKKENMINVKDKTCLECDTRPTFNLKGKTVGLYCSKHKKENMINVNSKTCLECDTRPHFNLKGKTVGLYCSKHKKENMINVKAKTCLDCDKQPTFNLKGKTVGLYCYDHKKENMINVNSKTCLECDTRPTFNLKGKTVGLYCYDHKKENMINVKIKTCLECDTQKYYGIPGNSPTMCAKHKKAGMIINPKSTCINKKCKEIAIYALNQKKAIHCEAHKEEGEINIIEKNCKTCNLPNILNGNSECTYCDPKHFNHFRLGKQLQVKHWLDANEFKYDSYDSAVNYTECGYRERPDFQFEAYNGCCKVILEVDEDIHRGRQESCECARMVNISQANCLPTLFIRYNPDKFKVNKKKKNPTHNYRMKVLKLVLETALNTKPEDLVGYCCIKQLYYNDFEESNICWNIITPFE